MKTMKSARAEHARLCTRLREVNAPCPPFRRWARTAGINGATSPKLSRILSVRG